MLVGIVIPTYNEAESIARVVADIPLPSDWSYTTE